MNVKVLFQLKIFQFFETLSLNVQDFPNLINEDAQHLFIRILIFPFKVHIFEPLI